MSGHIMDHDLPSTMRAWTINSRGPPAAVLARKANILMPESKTETDVLLRISHSALHPGTSLLMHIIPSVFRSGPKIAETDFSGEIVAAGPKAAQILASYAQVERGSKENQYFPSGLKVFGSLPVAAHLKGSGTLAQYVVAEVGCMKPVPKNMSMEAASCLSVSTITAVDVVTLANLKTGDRVLLNAPCGGIGTIATQLVQHAVGAEGHITGVCSSNGKELAMKVGCNTAVDYRPDCDGLSLQQRLRRDGTLYDAIIDCYGSQDIWQGSESYLKPDGVYATVGPRFPSMSYLGMAQIIWQLMRNMLTPAILGGSRRKYKQAASFIDGGKLEKVRKLAEDGVIKPYISKVYQFEEALEAYSDLMSGHAKGKIVIEVS